mgnify:CR=1 FL=1|tara:strand:+ start:556 stop:2733 length:2178 start_codon:yes stop_codon:yes gene_type:complete
MATWKGYKAVSVGLARVMGEMPFSQGTSANLIENWTVDENGMMSSKYRIMPLIPDEWNNASQPAPFTNLLTIGSDPESGVLAIGYGMFYGQKPEILFLTKTGVFRYTPGNRLGTPTYKGLDEQKYYDESNTLSSVRPTSRQSYPAQIQVFGNRMYFTFADGGAAWVWDGFRLRPFGYTAPPSAPSANGPERSGDKPNIGGFSVKGRVGSTDPNRTGKDSSGDPITLGGILDCEYQYAVVYENCDGAYSATSPIGSSVKIEQETASSDGGGVEKMLRRFRVKDIPPGPIETVARILLRTFNIKFLPSFSEGEMRFLHRIPNNIATEYIDDIPDGELGAKWDPRLSIPVGFYFIRGFSGSLWLIRTDEYPFRVWWSEQTSVIGPIAESVLEGHYLDVFPDTGEITATTSAFLEYTSDPVMLVFKKEAVHYIGGQYPQWQVGTIHKRAGCAGPNLVQIAPDNSVVWYGSNSFWLMNTNGEVIDIGFSIRKRLQRINHVRSKFGHSWIDRESSEVVFILPFDDSSVPNIQFVWDYKNKGWRIKSGLIVTGGATSIPELNTVLVGGVLGEGRNQTQGCFVLNRGYPGYSAPRPTSIYRTSWNNFSGGGPRLHSSHRTNQSILTAQESSNGTADISVFQDWNFDDVIGTTASIVAYNPESASDVPFFGTALFDSSVYRSERIYGDKLAVDLPSQSVQSISITTRSYFQLYNVDMFGPTVARPGGRTPTGDP